MSAEHESGLRAYAALFVLFLVLVAAGIFTVAIPELTNDSERAPDAGVQSPRRE